jgi:hypothetical protein
MNYLMVIGILSVAGGWIFVRRLNRRGGSRVNIDAGDCKRVSREGARHCESQKGENKSK